MKVKKLEKIILKKRITNKKNNEIIESVIQLNEEDLIGVNLINVDIFVKKEYPKWKFSAFSLCMEKPNNSKKE